MFTESDFSLDQVSGLILESECLFLAVVDATGKAVVYNRAASEILDNDINGLNFGHLLSPGSRDTLNRILKDISPEDPTSESILHVSTGRTNTPESYKFKFQALDADHTLIFGEPMQRLSNREATEYMLITNELSAATRELEKAKKALENRTVELEGANRRLSEEIEVRTRLENERERVIKELEKALAEVKRLSGLLPICASCKKIRDDKGYWRRIESYISSHSEAQFSHGICPDCQRELYPELDDE